jgi:beta-ribofuranosylaminobenzene 5'-phosphate synthase
VTQLVVTAPARLHFGMLDPMGVGARRFGGFGVGIEYPRVVVGVDEVRRTADGRAGSEAPIMSGPQADRAATFADRARSEFGLREEVSVNVYEAIPPHTGLGSGTKLALAIARATAELAGVEPDPERLAEASGRGARSSVGCWTFVAPGLVVEAGVREWGSISPVVARHSMPERWRCILAMPLGVKGLSGIAEERFFRRLHEPAGAEPGISRLLLTELLPGLVTGDLDEFGAALTQIQREMGSMFATEQGGVFHPRAAPLVDALVALGVRAVGQSSWGPTVYGIVDGPDLAAEVADRLRVAAASDTEVRVVDFDRRGAWAAPGAPAAASA